MTHWMQVALGFVLLLAGGELLIRGSVALARRLGVSPLLIGATVVAFGTSAPELAVCVRAAWKGHDGLALGSIVGSNLANAMLILGVAGVVSPICWTPRALRRDGVVLALASLLFLLLLGWGGELTGREGLAMVVLLGSVVSFSYWHERRNGFFTNVQLQREAEEIAPVPPTLAVSTALALGGLLGVALGAETLVSGAAGLARAFGVSEAAIGLTLVAVGTSLPELATSLVAAYRGHPDVALGNVIGSNVFNELGIGGTAAMVAPLALPREMRLDLLLMVGAMVLLAIFLLKRSRLGRGGSLALLVGYALWIVRVSSQA